MKILVFIIFLAGILLGWYGHQLFDIGIGYQKKVSSNIEQEQINVIPKKIIKNVEKIEQKQTIKNDIESKTISVVNAFHPNSLYKKSLQFLANKQYILAINSLKNLYIQVQDVYPKSTIVKLITQAVNAYLNQYSAAEFINNRLELLQNLVYLLPENPDIAYQLGLVFIQKQDFYQARQVLVSLLTNPFWQIQAKKLQKHILNAERFVNGGLEIPLTFNNNAWFVQANINNTLLNLLLDTGANLTTIKAKFINKNNEVDKNTRKRINVSTASGVSRVIKTQIKNLRINNIVDDIFTIAVLDNDKLSKSIDGLLGTDWLNRFYFTIDQDRHLLLLDKKDILPN